MGELTIIDWNIEALTGYKPKTTFYTDFSIADRFGADAIVDTYRRAFKHWHDNVEYVTELVMVLNWKIWEHYETNEEYGKLYNELWMDLSAWCGANLKGDDLSYYYRTID